MRLRSILAHGGDLAGGAVLEMVLLAGLCIFVAHPLAARPQDEPASAESEASDKTAPAKDAASKDDPKADASAPGEPTEEATEPTEPSDEKSRKTYPVRNGTASYGRTEEFEKKKTADGEIETERVRSPSYGGDSRLLYEKETRTKKLPDGSIEREYTLRNPDGSGRMMPIEITRERTRTGSDGKTTTEREMLRPDSTGKWQPLRKETVTQTGEEKERQSVKEVRERNLSGDWKLVDRTVTSEKTSEAGKATRSTTQRPNAYGELGDFEVREENTRKEGDKESTEVTVRRRDPQDTHNPKFFLVERTKTEQTKSADGKVIRKSATESDLVAEGASRDIAPGGPRVVEEKVEEETTAADGSTRRVVNVKERGSVNRELQPTGRIIQETDSQGNVRQILIPSR